MFFCSQVKHHFPLFNLFHTSHCNGDLLQYSEQRTMGKQVIWKTNSDIWMALDPKRMEKLITAFLKTL